MSDTYKDIEVNGTVYIMNEETAFRMFTRFCEQFGWVGTFFVPDDVRNQIVYLREAGDLDPLPDEALDEATNRILATKGWSEDLAGWMSEQGGEVIHDLIREEIES